MKSEGKREYSDYSIVSNVKERRAEKIFPPFSREELNRKRIAGKSPNLWKPTTYF